MKVLLIVLLVTLLEAGCDNQASIVAVTGADVPPGAVHIAPGRIGPKAWYMPVMAEEMTTFQILASNFGRTL